MKIRIVLILLFSAFLIEGVVQADDGHDEDEILLQLAPGITIQAIEQDYNVRTEDSDVVPGIVPPIYKVKVDDPNDLVATVQAMEQDNRILKVEFNFFGETPEGVRRTLAVIDSTPTTSEYRDQEVFSRIKALQAQALSTGQGVAVAVIDTGVDYRHPDIAGHILRDNNNDIIGYDFVDDDPDPMDETNGLDDDNDSQIDEGAGHGTHVAGIISLLAPDAKIMPLRVLNSEGIGTVELVAKAINFAEEYSDDNSGPGGNGKLVVINLSLGLPDESFTLLEALQKAMEQDVPIIASAGNDDSSNPHYPAASDIGNLDLIAVTATDPNDIKATFSNFGNWINVSAPGVGIYSTFLNSQFATWDGTSMAAPFVAAEAALIMSLLRASDPNSKLKLNQILPALREGIDDIYGVNPDFKKNKQLGTGRINMSSAVLIAGGADILTVKKVVYKTESQKLVIKIQSSASPQATLTVQGFGTMEYDAGKDLYRLKITNVFLAPTEITVTSSAGGIISPPVAIN